MITPKKLPFATSTVPPEKSRKMIVDKNIPNYIQSFRFLLNHLKTKLTAVASGAVKFEEEFMADLMVRTPEGPKRFAEALKTYNPNLLLEGPAQE